MTESELKKKLEASLDYLSKELVSIRTGRATPSMLDDIKVSAYESMLTVKEVASITVSDAQTLLISPWDKALLKNIAKAVRESNLNLNPAEQNGAVVVPIPPLTEERRVEFTKHVAQKVEECKISMRQHRNEAMKAIDTSYDNKEFGEDEKFSRKERIEDLIKEYVGKADEVGETKKADLFLQQ